MVPTAAVACPIFWTFAQKFFFMCLSSVGWVNLKGSTIFFEIFESLDTPARVRKLTCVCILKLPELWTFSLTAKSIDDTMP